MKIKRAEQGMKLECEFHSNRGFCFSCRCFPTAEKRAYGTVGTQKRALKINSQGRNIFGSGAEKVVIYRLFRDVEIFQRALLEGQGCFPERPELSSGNRLHSQASATACSRAREIFLVAHISHSLK